MGIAVTVLAMSSNHQQQQVAAAPPSSSGAAAAALVAKEDLDVLGMAKESSPALHYFSKASTDFVATLPFLMGKENSFLADLVTR